MLWLVLLQTTLAIATSGPATSPEYLPLWVAQSEGYFAQEGLAVNLVPARAETGAAEALARGHAQLAATSLGAALLLGHVSNNPPKLVYGLTAAPPVVLLVAAARKDAIQTLADLVGRTVAVPAPGGPADFALASMLARADIPVTRLTVQSFGDRGAVGAIEAGRADAASLGDPYATRLIEDAQAVALADLRKRGEPERWLGGPTVYAGLFARHDGAPPSAQLTALARALNRAVARIETAEPDDLRAKLPGSVVGTPQDFAIRLLGSRQIYLGDGVVTPDALAAGIALVRNRLPIPDKVKIPRSVDKLLLMEPTAQAAEDRRR